VRSGSVIAIILAIGAAAMLSIFVQQSSSEALSTTAVRFDEPDRPHHPTPRACRTFKTHFHMRSYQ